MINLGFFLRFFANRAPAVQLSDAGDLCLLRDCCLVDTLVTSVARNFVIG